MNVQRKPLSLSQSQCTSKGEGKEAVTFQAAESAQWRQKPQEWEEKYEMSARSRVILSSWCQDPL